MSRNTRLAPDVEIRSAEDFGIGTKIDAQRISSAADELYAQGKIDEALKLYKKAQSISSSEEMKKWVTRLENVIKERNAVSAANKMISRANALYNEGKIQEALEVYRESLKTHKNAEIEAFIKRQGNEK